ncbi:MAG: DMT family transporter [Hyphomicrobiaceae bacterium]|nr:DMT family transporter [Hyphomicrobiaceae bacterium]
MSFVERRREAPENVRPLEAEPAASERVSDKKPDRNDPIAGVLWVTLAMALFAGLAASSRLAMSYGYHPLQVAFLRFASALILMLPLLAWRGTALLRSAAPQLYLIRASISLFSMTCWFWAIALIPLGELTAIGFLSPLFGTLGAIVLLGEKVRLRRMTALAVGFIGAMIMLRPGMSPLGIGQGMALFSAMSGGVMAVLLKQLSGHDDPDKIVFLTTAIMTPLALIPALFVWQPLTLEVLPVLIVVGATGVLGHVSLMRGFRAADASLVLTFEFSRLPFAVALGFLMFGELIDAWTWIGAAVIFVSAVYIIRREAKLRREGRAGEKLVK